MPLRQFHILMGMNQYSGCDVGSTCLPVHPTCPKVEVRIASETSSAFYEVHSSSILVIGKSDVAASNFPRIHTSHLDSFPQLRGNDVVLRLHL